MVLEITIDPGNVRSFRNQMAIVDMAQVFETEFHMLGPLLAARLAVDTPKGATGFLAGSTDYNIRSIIEPGSVVTQLRIVQRAVSRPPPEARAQPQVYRPFVVKAQQPNSIPPSTAFWGWVIVKLGIPISDIKQVRRVAFLVARKIFHIGTEDNPYPIQTIQRSTDDIRQTAIGIGRRITVHIMDFDKLPP